jgi:hypothetical protein
MRSKRDRLCRTRRGVFWTNYSREEGNGEEQSMAVKGVFVIVSKYRICEGEW